MPRICPAMNHPCLEEHPMKRSACTVASLLFAFCVAIPIGASAADAEKHWKPLMDGKTLAGWHPVGDGKWTVEDGAFVGRANNEKLYGLLFSNATYKDFTVRFKFKFFSGDSGFYVRTVFKEPDEAHELQVQVGAPGSGLGRIYESYGRGWLVKPDTEAEKKVYKANDWNDMTISAHGGHVVVQVNGVTTCELKDYKGRPDGQFALQMHAGTVNLVMFKEIEIAE
jgi:hypothetical protein